MKTANRFCGRRNDMNEKKLTDEEVIKALDICYKMPHCTSECPYFNKSGRSFCKDHKLYNDLKRIVQEHTKQQVEIERLTLAVEGFKGENKVLHKENTNVISMNDALYREKAELQKQVEDWVRVHDEQLQAMLVLTIENKNLQKQVDELKEERDVFKNLFEHCNNSSITIDQIIESMNSFYREQAEHLAELKIEQAVKSTVKEVLQYVGDLYDDGDQRFRLKDYQWHKDLCKRYGVEVE
jgi:FtsZ-binding cell division protein ZapB